MGRTVIAPILGVIFLLIQLIFGVEVPEDIQESLIVHIANAVAGIVTIYGIVKSRQLLTEKEKEK